MSLGTKGIGSPARDCVAPQSLDFNIMKSVCDYMTEDKLQNYKLQKSCGKFSTMLGTTYLTTSLKNSVQVH